MHELATRLEETLREVVRRHVREIEQDEVLRDVDDERRLRVARNGEAAGDDYVRRVIASLESGDDE